MWLTIKQGAKEFEVEIDGEDSATADHHQQKRSDDEPTDQQHNSTDSDGHQEDRIAEKERNKKLPRNLGELREWICAQTDCDGATMKLIHRGKFIIAPMDQPLSSLNFKESDKIIVMGVLSKPDPGLGRLQNYEKDHLTKLGEIHNANGDDIMELEKNFLEGDMLSEMLRRMEKRLKEFTETALRHLESLDALETYDNKISDAQKQRNREKRKCLVDRIQNMLRENDKYTFRLQQYRKSFEYK